jgi:hypothetical protein
MPKGQRSPAKKRKASSEEKAATEVAFKVISKTSTPKKTTKARGGGVFTNGWKEAAPKKGVARQKLMKECGPDAYLLPSKLKFPIVAAGDKSCKPDCRGLQSAFVRAKQWKYDAVAKKADKMLTEQGCSSRKNIKKPKTVAKKTVAKPKATKRKATSKPKK